ncbi:hypothetical protein LINPERHAP2_LOCUS23905 [Linum perenne]
MTIKLSYEKIKEFCRVCGRIGHLMDRCAERDELLARGAEIPARGFFRRSIRAGYDSDSEQDDPEGSQDSPAASVPNNSRSLNQANMRERRGSSLTAEGGGETVQDGGRDLVPRGSPSNGRTPPSSNPTPFPSAPAPARRGLGKSLFPPPRLSQSLPLQYDSPAGSSIGVPPTAHFSDTANGPNHLISPRLSLTPRYHDFFPEDSNQSISQAPLQPPIIIYETEGQALEAGDISGPSKQRQQPLSPAGRTLSVPPGFEPIRSARNSPAPGDRNDFWEVVSNLSRDNNEPWLIVGDLNAISYAFEKQGGNGISYASTNAFRNFISNNSLIDLGFQGDPFTWSNGQQGNNEIKQRLDKALSCHNWRTSFDKALVFHEERIGSDHCPLLIHLQGKWRRKNCPFRFDSKWLMDPKSIEIISKNWNELPRENSQFLKNCTTDLRKMKFGSRLNKR